MSKILCPIKHYPLHINIRSNLFKLMIAEQIRFRHITQKKRSIYTFNPLTVLISVLAYREKISLALGDSDFVSPNPKSNFQDLLRCKV